MEQFEDIRKKALELFEELVLLHGSKYKQEIDSSGDTRYIMRGWDYESKDIRITFIIKEALIFITVIREEE